jgi:hypothetical protein
MTKVDERLEWGALRRDVSDVQLHVADNPDERRRAGARFLATVRAQSRGRRSFRIGIGWALGVAASIALASTAWMRPHSVEVLTFSVGEERVPGQVDRRLSTRPDEALPIHFSDGSWLALAAATRARITDPTPYGATLVVEDGAVNAVVIHRPHSSWRVTAGPFTVHVIGTRFDVRWRSIEQTFELDLHEGVVSIYGPSLAATGRRLSAGQKVRIARTEWPDENVGSSAVETFVPNAPYLGPPPVTTDPQTRPANAGPSWRQLALEEKYVKALAVAERENFSVVCRRASARDVLLLANTARFAGSAKRADQAYRAVRERFPHTHEAAMAAFFLGRIAYDDWRRFPEAARWFDMYLTDEPDGVLTREASGRLMEAQRAAGSRARASETATSYLARYPNGPHAPLARSLIGH